MSSVTFTTDVGGDGSIITDDDNATTGLGNGGALIRLVPMMQQVVNVAAFAVNAVKSALGGATTTATSITSLAIATGSKSLTLVETGKIYVNGQFVLLASTVSPSNYMIGQVTSFSGTALVLDVTVTNGSGTLANWTVSVTGKPPATGVSTGKSIAMAMIFGF
jgi:hypothetical protein